MKYDGHQNTYKHANTSNKKERKEENNGIKQGNCDFVKTSICIVTRSDHILFTKPHL